MIKAFYRKVLENIRKRIDLDLIDKTDAQTSNERQSKIFLWDENGKHENFSLKSINKENVLLSKPM